MPAPGPSAPGGWPHYTLVLDCSPLLPLCTPGIPPEALLAPGDSNPRPHPVQLGNCSSNTIPRKPATYCVSASPLENTAVTPHPPWKLLELQRAAPAALLQTDPPVSSTGRPAVLRDTAALTHVVGGRAGRQGALIPAASEPETEHTP